MTIVTMCLARIIIMTILHATILIKISTNPFTTNNSYDDSCPLLLQLFQLLLLFPFRFPFSFLFFFRLISRYDNSYNLHHQHNHPHPELKAYIYDNSSPLASTTVALQG
jgi:hypothetical protein